MLTSVCLERPRIFNGFLLLPLLSRPLTRCVSAFSPVYAFFTPLKGIHPFTFLFKLDFCDSSHQCRGMDWSRTEFSSSFASSQSVHWLSFGSLICLRCFTPLKDARPFTFLFWTVASEARVFLFGACYRRGGSQELLKLVRFFLGCVCVAATAAVPSPGCLRWICSLSSEKSAKHSAVFLFAEQSALVLVSRSVWLRPPPPPFCSFPWVRPLSPFSSCRFVLLSSLLLTPPLSLLFCLPARPTKA